MRRYIFTSPWPLVTHCKTPDMAKHSPQDIQETHNGFLNSIIWGHHSHKEIRPSVLLIEISENWERTDELEIQFFQTLEFHLDVDLPGSCDRAGLLRKTQSWAKKPGFSPCSANCWLCNGGQVLLVGFQISFNKIIRKNKILLMSQHC